MATSHDPKITWRPVVSSHVANIGWPHDPIRLSTDSGTTLGRVHPPLLLVMFKDGRCYGYLDVSRQRAVWMATQCLSVGGYMDRVIKKQFDAVRIPDLDATAPPF